MGMRAEFDDHGGHLEGAQAMRLKRKEETSFVQPVLACEAPLHAVDDWSWWWSWLVWYDVEPTPVPKALPAPIRQWWSPVDLSDPAIAGDFGSTPPCLTTVAGGLIVDHDPEVKDAFTWFQRAGWNLTAGVGYVVLDLKAGEHRILSMNEIPAGQDEPVRAALGPEATTERLKFTVTPVLGRLPVSLAGPATSSCIGQYYGENNCAVTSKSAPCGGLRAVVTIDVYSSWVIRTVLPMVAFVEGRALEMCLTDWPQRSLLCNMRFTTTKEVLKAVGRA
eukprot:CAMPEP_0204317016 /NCGR_PEP_ID=MMETSP0469-20131031/5728_1 /ASSEMBLY_ACC=CAM_ASM_000384 /TAXON_ID=2969 /ORGANISM="Oxyrrhis marina" /LENGTH=276 /DNA_ID=CAMNT_0051297875 /DNA_START=26 /DNA_END=857 /DNA_ORIENTATION=-